MLQGWLQASPSMDGGSGDETTDGMTTSYKHKSFPELQLFCLNWAMIVLLVNLNSVSFGYQELEVVLNNAFLIILI